MAPPRSAAPKSPARPAPLVGVIMGSTSDWETMRHAVEVLEELGVPYEKRVVSAHRTPRLLYEYAGAAALTSLPVLGVPVESTALKGLDSLCSIVQMPGGIPVATFAIGKPGAINAGLFAASILADGHPAIARALAARRAAQTTKVLKARLP